MKHELINGDCMKYLPAFPDNYFQLAIVDPPYGIREDGHRENQTRSKLAQSKKYHTALWDQKAPNENYFTELKRVSKNQIIWGANHFGYFPPSPCWIVWNKKNGKNHFADAELAWGSFDTAVRLFDCVWQGMIQYDMKNKETRIHPTQKPIKLYRWLLQNYAKRGDLILDTHVGSGSSLVACVVEGFDFVGYEIDKVYYDGAKKRIELEKQKLQLFPK